MFHDRLFGQRFIVCGLFLMGLLGASLIECQVAWGNTPRLSVVLPRGVQRGQQHTLRMVGERIGNAQQVFFYDSGISVVEIKSVDGNQIDVVVDVAENCRLGEHVVQVRTPKGISDFRTVYVGHLPHIEEVEPNSSIAQAQAIEMNVTVVGTITGEDVDYFVVQAKQGERISVEVQAIRLGFLFDAFVAILDQDRFELAACDDTTMFNQDPFVSIVAPADGEYTIMIREASYGGNGNCRYLMHVGNFPRPTAAFPAGGPPGSELDVALLGDPSGPIQQRFNVPTEPGFRPGLTIATEAGTIPSALPFRVNELPNHLETEGNNTWVSEPVLELPIAINGVISEPDEFDYFLFSAKQGQVWEVECYARRLGSGLDPVMNIFKASDKSHVVGNDDSRGPDSYLRFQVPEDGDYYIRIYDHLKRGQADFVYRLEMTPVQPSLGISIPRVDRYSQLRQTICVPRGNWFGTVINATRENIGGELKLIEEGLPPGVKMTTYPMLANLNSMPVVFEAEPEAELVGALVDLRVRLADESQTLTGGFSNLADFANGEPNQALYYGCTVNRLAMAVTEAAPFRIEIVTPQAPLVREGTYDLRVRVHRDEGFAGPVHLQFPFVPPGVGRTNQITCPPEQSEIIYQLNANGNAQLGTWPIFVSGYADVEGGQLWISTPMAELVIAEPFVKIEIPRAGCDQGQTAQLVATIEQLSPFEGEATLHVVGLPPNVTAEPVVFTAETTELVIALPTTAESPLGNHKSVFCQVHIPVAGERIVASTGRTELQINKPPPAPVEAAPEPAPAAAEQPATPPPAAPLSRLEQLRQRAKGGEK
jgi:hypothetical protein